MKKILLLLLISTFALYSCVNKKDEKTITIACNLPMSGYVGVYGEWMKRGIEMAMADCKDTLQHHKIQINFDYQDNNGENKEAINILQKQLISKPDIIFSGLTSQTMSIIDNVANKKIPHFLLSFTPLYLEKEKMNFRPFPNFGVESKHYIDFIKGKQPNKIAFLYLDIIGTNIQINDVVIPEITNPNIQIYNEKYPVNTTDFKSTALKIKQFNPDVLIINGFYNNITNIVNALSSFNIKVKNIMFSIDLLDAVNGLTKEQLENLHVTAPAFVIESKQTESMRDWTVRFRQKYLKEPAYFEAYAYDMATIICNASIESKLKNISLYESLRQVNLPGITGDLVFDENGELKHNMFTAKFINGNLVVEE